MCFAFKPVIQVLNELKYLLRNTDEARWASYFDYALRLIEQGDRQIEILAALLNLFKESGSSFSVLVLHKNGKWLVEENKQLKILKQKLRTTCEGFEQRRQHR